MNELENISLKNRNQELSRLIPIHQKDLNKICELEGEVDRLKSILKEFEKKYRRNI